MPRKSMRNSFIRSNTALMPSSHSSSRSVSPSSRTKNRTRSRYSAPMYSCSETMINETFKVADQIINKWNPENSMFSSESNYLFRDNRKEAKEFVNCMKDLQIAMNFLLFEDSNSEKLVVAQNLTQIAMKRLEKEFYQILSTNRDHLDPESISKQEARASRPHFRSRSNGMVSRARRTSLSDYEDDDDSDDEIQVNASLMSKVGEASSMAAADIKLIADCMISSGYGKECVKIYKVIRKSIMDEALYRLGIVHIKSYQIWKMDWEVLELKIKNWLNAVKVAVHTLFYNERVICEYVFTNSDAIRESCFADITKEAGIILFGFPKKIVKSKKPLPERIFRVLDIYQALADLLPEIDTIFLFESTSAVRQRARKSLTRLSDSIRAMVTEFESSVHKDSSKAHIHGGAVHPLTRHVTNYLCHLADYRIQLSTIFADWPLPGNSPLPESYFESLSKSDEPPASNISVRFAWLILVLLCKIDMKVEFYKDVALSYLFLANNLQFALNKVRSSNQRLILNEDWIAKHEVKVKQYLVNYEKIGWSKVFQALPEKPMADIPVDEVKVRFKKFNSYFESTCRKQSSWVISDEKLKKEIESSICKKIVPVYTQLYEKYQGVLNEALLKYTPDDLMNSLASLFQGTSSSSSGYSWTTPSEHGDT